MSEENEINFDILYDDLNNDEVKALDHTLHQRKTKLRFPEQLEKDFQHFYATKFGRHMRIAMLLSTAMFLLSYMFNLMIAPEELIYLLIQFGVVAPIILLMVGLSFTSIYYRYQQQIMFVSAMTISLGVLVITYHMPSPMEIMYMNGILLIMIYGLCFARMQFRNAIIFSIANFIAINFLLYLEPAHDLYISSAHNYIYLCGCILLLANNFVMEYAERQEYLQECLIQLEKDQLEQINTHLHKLANADQLTGLANNRRFTNSLTNEWNRAVRYQYPIALILLDFDQFKALNDTYGHQGGDEALRTLGATLKKFARRPGDLAVRYGGDEFVLMLVDADLESAMKIAQNIRLAIEELQIPNKNSNVIPFVTTTIGVASLTPTPDNNPEQLFKQADDALYLAKNQGRNCVCSVNERAEPDKKTA